MSIYGVALANALDLFYEFFVNLNAQKFLKVAIFDERLSYVY